MSYRRANSILRQALAIGFMLFGFASPAESGEITDEWAQNWQDDLRFIARQLPKTHPDAFHILGRESFDGQIDNLIAQVPDLSHKAIIVELTRIVSALGDGHTRVTLPISGNSGLFTGHSKTAEPNIPDIAFPILPIRLVIASDATFVYEADEQHAELVGAIVERIGDMSIDEAKAAVTPYVHHDNRFQLRYQLPDFLILPDVLVAAGVTRTAEKVSLTIRTASGERKSVVLESTTSANASQMVDVHVGRPRPRYAQHNERMFWYEVLAEQDAIYWQYNEVGNEAGELLHDFATKLLEEAARLDIEKLIIDLRRNRGGDNERNKAILHQLIRSNFASSAGRIFVITGGGTFSAAMMLSVDLEDHLPAVFVGTPTGSLPNHHGDSRKIRLPRSGITVRVSTLYWQYSDPRDRRRTILPHIKADFTVDDYRSGADPQLDAILASETADETLLGRWDGVITYRGKFPFSLTLVQNEEIYEGTINIPDLGVVDTALNNIVVEGKQLTAALQVNGRTRQVRAQVEGDRVYGGLWDDYRYRPIVLTRN